jgi:predicted nucleotidyltransferase
MAHRGRAWQFALSRRLGSRGGSTGSLRVVAFRARMAFPLRRLRRTARWGRASKTGRAEVWLRTEGGIDANQQEPAAGAVVIAPAGWHDQAMIQSAAALADSLRGALAGEDCVAAWLFGSRARGDASPLSDVDVAVLFGRPRPTTLLALPTRLHGALERTSGAGVDLIILDGADPDLIHRVLRDGVLLVDNDRAARIAFEVRSRNLWFDLEPVRRRYRAAR